MRTEETKKMSRGNYLELVHPNLISKEPFESTVPPELGFSASQRIQRHLLAMKFAELLGRVEGIWVQEQKCPQRFKSQDILVLMATGGCFLCTTDSQGKEWEMV